MMKITRYINPIKYWKKRGLRLGEECEIYPSASFGSEPYLIELGNHVRVNSGVNFVTHDGGCWVLRKCKHIPNAEQLDLFGKIKVGNNVHIGTNAFIMPGITIGNNCIIGCCAVVTKDIPDNSVAVGIPAHVIETVQQYYDKHKGGFDYTKNMTSEEKRIYLTKKYIL